MRSLPETYAEFSELLIELRTASNRRELIDLLNRGKIDWQTGIAERLTRLILDTVNILLDRMSEALRQDIQSMGGVHDGLGRCLVNARHWFTDMYLLANLQFLSAETSTRLREQIQDVANKTQAELEKLATRSDHTGKLLFQVRQNAVNKNYQTSPEAEKPSGAESINPGTGRRNIILP